AERDGWIAAEISVSGSRDSGVVRESRDSRDESVGQRLRPMLAAIERCVDAAAIVVIPVVVSSQEVLSVPRVHRERSFVLRRGVVGDIYNCVDSDTSSDCLRKPG